MDKAATYRSAAEALSALCAAHDAELSDTGLIDHIKDVIEQLSDEAAEAAKDEGREL